MIREIISVKASDDYSLECEMDNGEIYLYDMSFVREEEGEILIPFNSINFFKQVIIEAGHWNGRMVMEYMVIRLLEMEN